MRYPPAAWEAAHSLTYLSSVFVCFASSAAVIGFWASALYNPRRSPITTIPACTEAPKSLIKRPRNSFSLLLSTGMAPTFGFLLLVCSFRSSWVTQGSVRADGNDTDPSESSEWWQVELREQ